jgi:hypothetical protein
VGLKHVELARLLTTLPWLLGVLMGVPVFIVGVETFDTSKRVLFERPEIQSVTSPTGEDVPDIVSERGQLLHMVSLDDDPDGDMAVFNPRSVTGSIARFVAGPARVSKSKLPTIVEYEGVADRKVYVTDVERADDQPDVDLVHFQPASWSFELPPLVETHQVPDGDGDLREVRSVNWERIAMFVGGGAALAGIGAFLFGPFVGVAAFPLPLLVSGITPTPGEAIFQPAPAHATVAKAQRVAEVQERARWDTFAELERSMAEMDTEALEDALEMYQAYRSRMRDKVDHLVGAPDAGDQRNGRASSDD